MISLSAAALFAWSLLFGLLVTTAVGAILQPWLAKRRRRIGGKIQPVSIVIPLKHDTPGLLLATASAMSQAYPIFDVTLCAAEGESPAMRAACRAAESSSRPWRFLKSFDDKSLANPKIRNLKEAILSAEHDLILSKDANTILPPDMLGRMVAQLHSKVGLVAAVPIGRAPLSLAGQIECALINTQNARLLLAASCLGLGFGLGAAMVFRRSDLNKAGGLKRIGNAIADDQALSAALADLGLKTVFVDGSVDQLSTVKSLEDLWRRHTRWAICRRIETPFVFALEPFTGALAAAALASLAQSSLAGSVVAALLTLAMWIGIEIALALVKKWPVSILTPVAIIGREVLYPLIWLRALFARKIRWGSTVVPVARVKAGQR